MLDDTETATNGVYAARSWSILNVKQGEGKIVSTNQMVLRVNVQKLIVCIRVAQSEVKENMSMWRKVYLLWRFLEREIK